MITSDGLTSVSHDLPYFEFCNRVANDPTGELVKTFRSAPDYDQVVPGSRSPECNEEQLKIIRAHHAWLLPYLPIFAKQQGEFGCPKTYEIDGITWDSGILAQLHILGMLVKEFGPLSGMHICEIGSGCGLLFKLITDLYPDVRYTFVDLDSPLAIVKQHVAYLSREANVHSYLPCAEVGTGAVRSFDLVVSNGAFDELDATVQRLYAAKLLARSRRGWLAFCGLGWETWTKRALGLRQMLAELPIASKYVASSPAYVEALAWNEAKHERD